MVAVGEPDAIAAAIRRWAGQGADTIVLQPTADEAGLEAFIAFRGREVRPLVQG